MARNTDPSAYGMCNRVDGARSSAVHDGRDGLLPEAFGRAHARYRTPFTVLLSGVLVVYLVAEALSSRAAGVWMFGVVMLVGVTAYRLRVRRRPWLRETIGAWDEPSAGDVLGGAVSDVRRD